jgi:diguanylate cyclase (GGDEF)-like protein
MPKAWLTLPTPEELHDDTSLISRVIGVLYGAGAILVSASLLLPHPADSKDAGIFAIAATAGISAVLLWVLAQRLPAWALQVMIGLGSVLISLCVYFAGQPSAYVAMFIWVVLASGFFFPGRPTAIQMAWLVITYGIVLFAIPDGGYSPVTRLVLTGFAFGTAAAVVSWLSESLNRRVEASESRARTDPLTGIANRRWLNEELTRELARARRQGVPMCAALIDIDDLKAYNDKHGHLAGDRLIVSAVEAWRGAIRPRDFLARVGGDEFMLLMPDCPPESAQAVIDRVRQATPEESSCSAGLALWDGAEGALELFNRADAALYAAKHGGGDRTDQLAPVG